VSDPSNHSIQVFDSEMFDWITQIGRSGSENGQFYRPGGVVVNSKSILLVVDSGGNRVQMFDESLEFIKSFGSFGFSSGQFSGAIGIAVDKYDNDTIYVVDQLNQRVQVFHSDGTYKSCIGRGLYGSGDGEFVSAWDVAVSQTPITKKTRVFVTDVNSHQVQVFSDQGDFLFRFGSKGCGPGQFVSPCGITVSNDGELIVCDRFNCRIQVFDSENGSFLHEYGGQLSHLHGPTAIAFSQSSRRIIVSPSESSSVQAFQYKSLRWPWKMNMQRNQFQWSNNLSDVTILCDNS